MKQIAMLSAIACAALVCMSNAADSDEFNGGGMPDGDMTEADAVAAADEAGDAVATDSDGDADEEMPDVPVGDEEE